MAEQTIVVRGGKDLGDCVQVEGIWYIRRDSWFMNGAEMEEGFDMFLETGYYSKLELPLTEEDQTFVQNFIAEKERKEAERQTQLYKMNNTATFLPEVGQHIYNPRTGSKFTIVELSDTNHMIRVRQDGQKSTSWYSPYNYRLIGEQGEAQWYDLNDVKATNK